MTRAPQAFAPSELAETLAAERTGAPFLAYRDGEGELSIRTLEDVERLAFGRLDRNDLVIDWDPEVSRFHAELDLRGEVWTIVDDGQSRNGSFVNGERVVGRHRLADGDVMRLGRSSLVFRSTAGASKETSAATDAAALAQLTQAERRVLVALCRPFAAPGPGATPASNRQVADELSLSVDGVKTRVRALFCKLEIDELPQNRKRAELARRALEAGLVTQRELRD